jgi:SpoVK/Ycf46/Vps4 family AAA+-type ATPase
VDLDQVEARTDGLTAADIAEIWKRAAQRAFERELADRREARVTTADLLAVADSERPSLGSEALEAFECQVQAFARL